MAWGIFGKKKDEAKKVENAAVQPINEEPAPLEADIVNANRERGNQIARVIEALTSKVSMNEQMGTPEDRNAQILALKEIREGFQTMTPIIKRDMRDYDKEINECLKVMNGSVINNDIGTLALCAECLKKAVETRPEANENDVVIIKLYVSRSRLSLDIILCERAKSSQLVSLEGVTKSYNALDARVDAAMKEGGKSRNDLKSELAQLTNYETQIAALKIEVQMQQTTISEYETQMIALKTRIDGVGGVLSAEDIKEITELSNKIGAEHVATYVSRMNALTEASDAARAITKTAQEAVDNYAMGTIDPALMATPVAHRETQKAAEAAPVAQEQPEDEELKKMAEMLA